MKVSISDLQQLTGLPRGRVRAALADLESTQGPKGAFLYESSEALARLPLAGDDGASYDFAVERARLAHWQANKAQADAEKLRGELVEIEHVAATVGQEYAAVRAKLLAIPSKAAPELAHMMTPAEVQERLRDLIYEALEELSADK